MTTDPNSFDQEFPDAPANPQNVEGQGTEQTEPVQTEPAPQVDYKVKFAESSKEAQRLLSEVKTKEQRIAELEAQLGNTPRTEPLQDEPLYPGFEQLDEDAQRNLLEYTNAVKRSTLNEVYKDPAIAFARQSYARNRWDSAFSTLTSKYPDLADKRDEFTARYFNPQNVPDNLDTLMDDLAKIFLFDAKSAPSPERLEVEDTTGGDKQPAPSRSLAEWEQLAASNPTKFADMREQFDADMALGRLKE